MDSVHDTLLALDVLLADGAIVTCTPENEHRDLFFGFRTPTARSLRAQGHRATVPGEAYVRIEHVRHADRSAISRPRSALPRQGGRFSSTGPCSRAGRSHHARPLADQAPHTSDYTFEHIYYARSARRRPLARTKASSGAGTPIGSGAAKNLFAAKPLSSEGSWAKAPQLDDLRESDALGTASGRFSVPSPASSGKTRSPSYRTWNPIARRRSSCVLPPGDRHPARLDLPIGGYDRGAKFPLYQVDPGPCT